MDSRQALVDKAERIMREAGRLPERHVLEAMPENVLRKLIEYWSGPFIVW
jgi:hypothetical protein